MKTCIFLLALTSLIQWAVIVIFIIRFRYAFRRHVMKMKKVLPSLKELLERKVEGVSNKA